MKTKIKESETVKKPKSKGLHIKDLKKTNLYFLELEYELELGSGKKAITKEVVIGYVKKGCFYGTCFGHEKGCWYGGDTCWLKAKQFNECVKSVKEIASGVAWVQQ